MKKMIRLVNLLLLIGTFSACQQDINETHISVVIPIEHKAMQEIIAGLNATLKETYPTHLKINIKNAQNDLNLQRGILQQINDNNNDLVITIGLSATQMAASMIHTTPIIGLAANLSDTDRKKLTPCHMAIVHDEIAPAKLLTLLQAVHPKIKQITLVHSSAEKVYPEVKEAVAAGKKLGIEIQPVMAATLPDLTSVAHNLPHTQAIMVLKDHLIVSGINVLVKVANQQHIPLITLDQGSVGNGASFALAVHEREIGVQGAKLAIAILKGTSSCDLPITEMNTLTVFMNKNSLEQQKQNIITIKTAAKKLNYNVEYIKTES